MTPVIGKTQHPTTLGILYMACELSENTWKLSVTTGYGQQSRECHVPARHQACILDEIPQAVVGWFKNRPQAELDPVEVVGVVDMSKTFDSAVKAVFGEPVPVMDRFHVVKQAVEALDSVVARGTKTARTGGGQSPVGPLQRMVGTLSRWADPIVRCIRHRYTNGMTEEFNNKTQMNAPSWVLVGRPVSASR